MFVCRSYQISIELLCLCPTCWRHICFRPVCPTVRPSVLSSLCSHNWRTVLRNVLKMEYGTMYLKMKSQVVFWRFSDSRWPTERNIYAKGTLLHIDLKMGVYVDWCRTNTVTPKCFWNFGVFAKSRIFGNFLNFFFQNIGL